MLILKNLCKSIIPLWLLASCNTQKENKYDLQQFHTTTKKSTNGNGATNSVKDNTQKIPIGNQASANDSATKQEQDTAAQTKMLPQTNVSVSTNNNWNKKIIKTATLRLEVKNFKNYNDLLYNKVKEYLKQNSV